MEVAVLSTHTHTRRINLIYNHKRIILFFQRELDAVFALCGLVSGFITPVGQFSKVFQHVGHSCSDALLEPKGHKWSF